MLLLGTLFVGIPSSIVYELRFDHESRAWADENAPSVVHFVSKFFDIRGSEVDPEFAMIDRGTNGPIDIDVRFKGDRIVRLRADPEESVYSVVHRAAQSDSSVSFRDVVDVKASGDADDLLSTGLSGISSPLAIMEPSRKAAEELRAVLAELRQEASGLRERLAPGHGRAAVTGVEKMMGWDKLRKLEMTIEAGEQQLGGLESAIPGVEATRRRTRDSAAVLARRLLDTAREEGRPAQPWVGIAPGQLRL